MGVAQRGGTGGSRPPGGSPVGGSSAGGRGAGGRQSSAGGAPASAGGAPASAGGALASVGGAPASAGGAPASVGGAPPAAGGAPARGDTAAGCSPPTAADRVPSLRARRGKNRSAVANAENGRPMIGAAIVPTSVQAELSASLATASAGMPITAPSTPTITPWTSITPRTHQA